MNDHVDDQSLEARARRRVDSKLGFFTHALVYLLVNAGLYVLNLANGGERWHQFPLLGWGLGLAIHGLVVFLSLGTEGWKQQMLQRELQHLRQRDGR